MTITKEQILSLQRYDAGSYGGMTLNDRGDYVQFDDLLALLPIDFAGVDMMPTEDSTKGK